MSKLNDQLAKSGHRLIGGICQHCRHNLFVRGNGKVYCSRRACPHHLVRNPHPVTSKLND